MSWDGRPLSGPGSRRKTWTMEVTIRPAAPADCARIADIYNVGIEERSATFETRLRGAPEVARWLEGSRRCPVIVAEGASGVVGWARVGRYSEREAYRGVGECQVYVEPAGRGRGVGTRLLLEICHEAERLGYWKLVGRVFADNRASRALVDRCGFREVGVHLSHGRLDGEWRDVVLVEILLGPAAVSAGWRGLSRALHSR
jgi:L-amino acid N-acyltransferase YncA